MASTERVRFTVAADPEVYEAFADLAHSSGVSISRCIGDWLRDTVEAAQITTVRVNEVRKAHQDIHREYLDSTAREVLKIVQGEVGSQWRAGPQGQRIAVPPRPVIRGGKSPGKTLGPTGKKP